ncbi:MAG: M20/M25/M40 family metallo-hydrolase [Vicinamibacterales bacterium]
MNRLVLATLTLVVASDAFAQGAEPDWARLEAETLQHFQALVRLDTSDPPGGEAPAVAYLKQVFEKEGIPVAVFAQQPNRPNLVARLKGSGRKRPVLVLGHTDTVNVDPKKWTIPPFSAARDSGWIYGRGTVDDKDNVVAGLMLMLELKRLKVPLDRDVIFLAEAGEEGASQLGIQFMANQHFPEIDAEYCFAEGGNMTRVGGELKYGSIQTLEKLSMNVEVVAKGTAGHASVPLLDNAVAHVSAAVAALAAWRPPIRLNETTSTYFERLASVSAGEEAERYRGVLDPAKAPAVVEYFLKHEPRHASMVHTSLSPTIIQGGYRSNVIPSDAKATINMRAVPEENVAEFLDLMKKVVDDPAVELTLPARGRDAAPAETRIDSEAFKAAEAAVRKHYNVITLPMMSTGATDMRTLRGKGMQCYGVGPALDVEDGPKGFGAHSDQERIVETELHRFVRFHYDLVLELARAR